MPEAQSKTKSFVPSIRWIVRIAIILAVLIGGIWLTYSLYTGKLKTGFDSDVTITKSEKRNWKGNITETTTTTTLQDAKNLWDWLSLLGVPVSLAILGYVLQQLQQFRSEQQAKAEKEIAESNQREEVLQNYLDRLSELLIDKNLIAEAERIKNISGRPGQELVDAAKDVIRARTLSILRRLEKDGERKRDVIRFLIEAQVISKLELDLSHADLSGANLGRADLSGTDLRKANLQNANLMHAVLKEANLGYADLSGANLSHAVLQNANLNPATLIDTDLSYADLSGANFSGARLNNTDLSHVDRCLSRCYLVLR